MGYITPVYGTKGWVRSDELLLPREYECELRRALEKTIPQPELSRKSISWFERFRHAPEVLRTLLEDKETQGGTFGFGNNPSPIREYMLGYVYRHLGDRDAAARHFQGLLESGKMEYVHERLKAGLVKL